ncbi:MAG: arsenate reductase ArsC [Chloroflexota bacterium]
MTQQRVLILCTGNSARSQMAEGLLRKLAGERVEVFSAGSKPSVVNPFAIHAMARHGIDISGQRSKHLSEFLDQPFDTVITVCDQAAETCPIFLGKAQRIHWSFPDPAAAQGGDKEILAAFEQVRNDLEGKLAGWNVARSG